MICLLACACSKDGVEKITFSEKDNNVQMLVGGIRKLEFKITPEKTPLDAVTWQSSDPTVAEVIMGYVYAHEAGTATITASAGKASATINVQVNNLYVTHATFSTSSLEIPVGGVSSFEITSITPDYANESNILFEFNPADRDFFEITEKSGMKVSVKCKEGTPDGKTATLFCSGAGDNSLGKITVVAANRPLTSISIEGPQKLRAGTSCELHAVAAPSNTTSATDFIWSSSKTSVLKVEATGDGSMCTVTGISEGTSTVTLKEMNSSKSVSCIVTVLAARDYSKLDLCLYSGYVLNSDGTYSMTGKDEFPGTILPGARAVDMYLGLSDGMPLTMDDYAREDISVKVAGKIAYPYPCPDGGMGGQPFFVPVRINEINSSSTITVETPAGKKATKTFKTAIKSVTIEWRDSKDSFSGFQNHLFTLKLGGSQSLSKWNVTLVTFCLNSGDEVNTWDIKEPAKMMFGSCSANAAYYDMTVPSDITSPYEGEYFLSSTLSLGMHTFKLKDYPVVTWGINIIE